MARTHLVVSILVLLAQTAAAAPELTLDDPRGDAGSILGASILPCAPAIDVLTFTGTWASTGITFTYTYDDLGAIEAYSLAQDMDSRCIYSYTDFEAQLGSLRWSDAIYFDYNSNPAFQTGWRFYLHENRDELNGTVDFAADTITIFIPDELLGGAGPGDRLGNFSIQSITAGPPAGYHREADWIPDSSQGCECWLTYPNQTASPAGPSSPDPPGEPARPTPSPQPASSGVEGTDQSSSDQETLEAPGEASPLTFGWLLVALLVAQLGTGRNRRR